MSETKVVKSHKASGRPEDSINFITFALFAVLSFVGLVFLLLKTLPSGAGECAPVAIFGVLTVTVFTVGAFAHAPLRAGKLERFFGHADRCFVCVLALAAMTPVMIVCASRGNNSDGVWLYTLYAVACACTVTAVAVNIADIAECKLTSLLLYVTVACAFAARADLIVAYCGMDCLLFLIGGFLSYFVATVVTAFGGMPARHTLRHLFTGVGAALHYVCIFTFLL